MSYLFIIVLGLLAQDVRGLRTRETTEARGPMVRQRLGNLKDMQYFGSVKIGNQLIKAILDTGSFELVAFPKTCTTCGIAPAYSYLDSRTFQAGTMVQVHAYGSGSCTAKDGFDDVSIDDLSTQHQALWLALRCQIPMLSKASFNAILGLGPPGQPEFTAERELKSMEEYEQDMRARHQVVPGRFLEEKAAVQKSLEAARQKKSVLENLGVTTFSTCLGREPESPGWLIWNDATRKDVEGVVQVPISGNITWGVQMKDMKLSKHGQDMAVGCGGRGCGAIVDTGTSLFAVPSHIYTAIAVQLSRLGLNDCSDLSGFPDLVMELGGKEVRFPPSSYLGTFYGQMDADVGQFVSTQTLGESEGSCQLLLMDLGPPKQTTLGDMIVLGMPFFREYYTTFDLGTGRGNRSLFLSPATEGCEPEVGGLIANDRLRQSLRNKPRRVDASKLRVPHWLGKRDSL